MVSFSRVSSVLCFGCHVVGSCSFGEPLLRDVTGKALLCSRCSVVLRHWHGPRLHKWLVSKVRVQRTGARWRSQLRGVSEMFKPCSRESERQKRRERAPLARRFKQTNLALPAGGLSNPIVRMGPQTGTCLKRRPPIITIQTCRSTLKL